MISSSCANMTRGVACRGRDSVVWSSTISPYTWQLPGTCVQRLSTCRQHPHSAWGSPTTVSVWREPNVRWRPDSALYLFCCLLFISIFPPRVLAHTSYTLRLLTRPAGHPAGAAPGCDAFRVPFRQCLFLLLTGPAGHPAGAAPGCDAFRVPFLLCLSVNLPCFKLTVST